MPTIAFYLPQYHPIPENDRWWGKGFTDWVNVRKARPRFKGHYQPHIPADLGYYDLRSEKARLAQAKLAVEYGIGGFCYYHYYFNGKLLLERPFNEVLTSGKPDFPFCLCWANENWTKRWDGLEREVLMAQNYDAYDPLQHIDWLDRAFSDRRYIKINGKPLFLVLRPDMIPNLHQVITVWRQALDGKGYPGLYLGSVDHVFNRLTRSQAIAKGFDGIVEFHPAGRKSGVIPCNRFKLRNLFNRTINKLKHTMQLEHLIGQLEVNMVFNYSDLVQRPLALPMNQHRIFPCVMPMWDNSARTKVASIYPNDDEKLYGRWLEKALTRVQEYPEDEQIVFINAWNEWAEGCHLEPDIRNGRKFLEETRRVLQSFDSFVTMRRS